MTEQAIMANKAPLSNESSSLKPFGFALPYKYESQISLTILIPSWPVIIIFGIFSNVATIAIFLKAGVKDSVTTLLFSLAVSDATFLLLVSPTAATYVIFHFAPNHDWPFHTNLTFFLLYWPAFTMYDFSAYISISTGVIRCACVAMPLRFKSVFTRSRTIKLIPALLLLAVALRMPVLTMFHIGYKLNSLTNKTEVILASRNRKELTMINDLLNRNSLPYIYFIIMITCVVVMTVKLYEATRVRSSHTRQFVSESTPTASKSTTLSAEKVSTDTTPRPGPKMSAKDIQVVQSVVLVCSIFILSQLPFLLYSTARLIEPEFSDKGRYAFLFRICSTVSLTCSFLNASVNIFVYYRYNTKYRLALRSIFNVDSTPDKE